MGIAVLACVAASSQPGTAAVLFGAADVRFQSHDARLSPADRRDYEEVRARVRSRLGDALFTDQWNRGHAMSMEEAIKYALGEN